MFALVAAILFLIGAIKVGPDAVQFWLMLGLSAWALHFAFDFGFPAIAARRVPPQ